MSTDPLMSCPACGKGIEVWADRCRYCGADPHGPEGKPVEYETGWKDYGPGRLRRAWNRFALGYGYLVVGVLALFALMIVVAIVVGLVELAANGFTVEGAPPPHHYQTLDH